MTSVLFGLWSVRTLRAVLQWTSLWQLKEYRWDRLRAHLALPSTRSDLARPNELLRWGLLLLFLADRASASAPASGAALALIYALETGRGFAELARGQLRRPRPTPKALAIGGFAAALLVTSAALGVRAETPGPLLVLLLDRATPLLIALGVALLRPPTAVARAAAIRRATRRIRAHPHLVSIGITGSYGKSSTKEFLGTILTSRFRVFKTPANVNTEIGIAAHVLEALRDEHEVFVCEMGAYRAGEVARAAAIVRPSVGILTAIGPQHLALFGSMEEIRRAKGELFRSLPPTGIAVANGDDPACVRLADESPARRRIRFGLEATNDVRADGVEAERERLRFTLHVGTESAPLEVPLVGAGAVRNLLAAAAAAHALGLTVEQIAEALRAVRPLPRTMEPRSGPRGSFVIDDTYSANPDGVIAALEALPSVGAGKTVVVLASMIELGPASAEKQHRRVGAALGAVRPALTVVTSPDYADALRAGAAAVDHGTAHRIAVEPDPERALARVTPLLGPGTVVLLEGRIPEGLRRALLGEATVPRFTFLRKKVQSADSA